MKALERLPEQCKWETMPDQMIEYYGYTSGKMSDNEALTMWGHVGLVIKHWLGRGYT